MRLFTKERCARSVPPAAPAELAEAERLDRVLLLGLAAAHGPIFRYHENGQEVVCIADLAMGRRVLRDHSKSLCPLTIDITNMVALGFMRQMRGETHTKYRKSLIEALGVSAQPKNLPVLHRLAKDALTPLTSATGPAEQNAQRLSDALGEIATGFLLLCVLGAHPGSTNFSELTALFRALGPHGLIWNIGTPQEKAFQAIAAKIKAQSLNTEATNHADGVLQAIERAGALDDTLLGNLIYMVEMGRYDMKGLFRWLVRYAALHPEYLTKIANADEHSLSGSSSYAKAFVLETLRMDQSERLMRNVESNFVFEGYQIKKDTMLRICMWEAHKDRDRFAQPFRFDPTRFLSNPPGKNSFSPFGLDTHQCPFSSFAVSLASSFMQTLAQNFVLNPINDGPAVRGPFHWEPPPGFHARLSPRHP